MKLNIILLIVLVLSLPGISQDYKPPSDSELWEYWQKLTKEQQIEEIRKLDVIENTVPEILLPEYTAVLLKNGDLLILADDVIKIKISYLEYDIKVENIKLPEFYFPEKKTFKDFMIPILFCAGTSLIATAIAGKDTPVWKYVLSAGQGITFGFLLTLTR